MIEEAAAAAADARGTVTSESWTHIWLVSTLCIEEHL